MSCLNFNNTFKYGFSKELILQTRDLNKLLTLDLELSHKCNYACKYCYTAAGVSMKEELNIDEVKYVIDQAYALGVDTIIIIGGGEPLIYPQLKGILQYIAEKGVHIVLFTNGAALDKDMAELLYHYDVFPVIKVNGVRAKTINWLCGNKGAYQNFLKALINLQNVGYFRKKNEIGISTIICNQNYDEMIPLWTWARENGIIPYFERVSPQGRAQEYDLRVSSEDLKQLFEKFAQIDKDNYDIEWQAVNPPIAGTTCDRHFYSLYIRANGDVMPCAGIDLPVGNVRDHTLQDIIINSPVIQDLRHADQKVKGKCKNCDANGLCYGCRGNAYQLANDYLAEDPLCWVNGGQG